MYICHCCRVTDHAIFDAIAHGARSIDDIAGTCAAGSQCGGCWPALQELLTDAARAMRAADLAAAG